MSSLPPAAAARSFVTHRPVAVLMLFLAAVVFGIFSCDRLPVTLMPELTYPTLTVRTEFPGAAPEEVENDISRPIEEALGVIGGLRQVSSISRAEVSDVVLEFAWDMDMSEATQNVLERLDLVFLPDEAKRPLILHFDPSLDPVMEFSLAGSGVAYEGEAGLRRLRRLAELYVKRQLEPIEGVAAVRVKGGLEEEIHILLDEEQLRRTGISIQEVIDRISQENINVAGGTIQEGRTEYLVRTLNEYEDLSQIEQTIVRRFSDRDVRLKDLARVERAHKERQIITRTGGAESVQIEIFKEADANIVALAKRVKARVGKVDPERTRASAQAEMTLAQQVYEEEGADLTLVADRSLFIESSIREVWMTAGIGGLLAVIVLFLFLRSYRTTAIIAVSIPISILVTFAPLNLLGVSLNVMSLGGLALGIGMLVDSSIVVLESIHRCREEGDDVTLSAIRGAAEVRSAVWASTLTSIAVFFPMVFVEGVAGQAFGDLGFAVVVSLLAAAGVALYFIPMLASRGSAQIVAGSSGLNLLRFESVAALSRDLRAWKTWVFFLIIPVIYLLIRTLAWFVFELMFKLFLAVLMGAAYVIVALITPLLRRVLSTLAWLPLKLTDMVMGGLQSSYPGVIRWALKNPALILMLVVLTTAGTWLLAQSLDSELLPEVRQGEFTVEVALPVGTPLEETDAVLSAVERAILAERDNIESLILTVGYDPTQSQRSDEGEHTAKFKVLLSPTGRGRVAEDAVVERLRSRFANIPDLKSNVTRPVLFSSKTPVEVEVHGDDLRALKDYSDRAQALLLTMPELADVRTTLQTGAPEIQVLYDRDRLTRYGLNVSTVAYLVRNKVQGFEASRFNLLDRRIPMVVRLREEDRATVTDIEEMMVNPGGERPVELSSVAQVLVGEGPSEVRRIDGRRVALVTANIAEGSLGSAVGAIESKLRQEIDWPEGMNFFLGGQSQEWERSRGSLVLALALSIFLVYVIMAVQFESLLHPLIIMFTIPLAFVGTVVALRVLAIPLSVVVFLGMIMLAGIVVNNAIVMVDYVNQLRRRGMPRDEALVTAGQVRLRPILMTTATTVLGLLPMALGAGDGAEIRTPMAIAVISGLISSTFLTLLVIPTMYASADSLVARIIQRPKQQPLDHAKELAQPGVTP